MSVDLLGALRDQLGGLFAEKVSGTVNESVESTAQALADILPVILTAVVEKGEQPDGGKNLIDFISTNSLHGDLLDETDAVLSSTAKTNQLLGTGNRVLNFIFNRSSGVFDDVLDITTQRSNIARSSVSSCIKLVGPLILSQIGKEVKSQGLNADGLSQLLQDQKSTLQNNVPKELWTKFQLKESTPQEIAKTEDSSVEVAVNAEQKQDEVANISGLSRREKLIPWFVLVTTAGLLWIGMRSCGGLPRDADGNVIVDGEKVSLIEKPTPASEAELPKQQTQDQRVAPPSQGRQVQDGIASIVLPSQEQITVAENGMIDELYQYITSTSFDPDRKFTLRNIVFEPKSAAIPSSANKVLQDLGLLLKAFPAVQVRIEGHTDDRGNGNENLTISEKRALAIKQSLSNEGIGTERIRSVGVGESRPIASNATEEGRSQNQRIDLVVTQK